MTIADLVNGIVNLGTDDKVGRPFDPKKNKKGRHSGDDNQRPNYSSQQNHDGPEDEGILLGADRLAKGKKSGEDVQYAIVPTGDNDDLGELPAGSWEDIDDDDLTDRELPPIRPSGDPDGPRHIVESINNPDTNVDDDEDTQIIPSVDDILNGSDKVEEFSDSEKEAYTAVRVGSLQNLVSGLLRREHHEAEFRMLDTLDGFLEIIAYFGVKNHPFIVGFRMEYRDQKKTSSQQKVDDIFTETIVNITFEAPTEQDSWEPIESIKGQNYLGTDKIKNYLASLPRGATGGFYHQKRTAEIHGEDRFSYFAQMRIVRDQETSGDEFSYQVEESVSRFIFEVYKFAKSLGLEEGPLSPETCNDPRYNVRGTSRQSSLMTILDGKNR